MSPGPAGSPRALVVDDDDALEVIEEFLGGRGVACDSASSAQAALDLWARRHDYGVVLTDVQMSGMDGIELCHRLRELAPDLPVIVITGFACVEVVVRALRAGAFDFFQRPVDLESLGAAVDRALLRRPALVTLDEVERRYIRQVLDVVRGNKSRASRILGVNRRTLYRFIDRERAAGRVA